ncbi:serine hydrolase domain-containing protein [Chitinophaga lutea]
MKHFKRIYCLLLLSFIAANSHAQTELTYNRQALDSLLSALDGTIQRERMPGLMVSIVTRDSILYAGGIGVSDIASGEKTDSRTLFHLASITKTFTALGIQKLISEGKLRLDDPIASIAPEIPFENQWEKDHPVRIIHLLEHTAGFDDVQLNQMINTTGRLMRGIDAVRFVESSLRSRWPPGEKFAYSNNGYVVLGYLIEKVSGKPWHTYIAENVFQPLGMRASLLDLDGSRQPGYATGYHYDGAGYVPFPFYPPGGNGAGSALVSNADDMARFLQHLLNGWNTVPGNWLTENDLRDMETVHSTLAAKHGLQTGYSLGLDLFPNNRKITFRGHNGKGEGFGSWIFYNRDAGIAYAISNNSGRNLWPVSVLIEKFLTAPFEKPGLPVYHEDLSHFKSYEGYYRFTNPRSDMWNFYDKILNGFHLSFAGNKLVVARDNGETDTLVHAGGSLFRASGDIIPAYVIGKDEAGVPFFQGRGGAFFTRAAKWPVSLQKIMLYACLAAMIFSILALPVYTLLATFKKASWKIAGVVLAPALAVAALPVAYKFLRTTDDIDKAAFTTINPATLTIFTCSAAFGILTILGAWLLFKHWGHIRYQWVRWTLAVNIGLLCYLAGLLMVHGLIGVRIWAL